MTIRRNALPTTVALLLLGAAPGVALAELGDPPVWNLWDGQIGTSTVQTGHGSRVTLCGTADCGGDQSSPPGTPNPNPTNAGVAIFEVDTVGPIRSDGVTPFFNSAGTGHINPFLRFQHNENQAGQPYGGQGSHSSGGVEAAYNTDDRSWPNVRTLQDDSDFVNQAKDANQYNHSVRIGDIVQFNADGVEDATGGFFGFWLDINEPGTDTKRTILMDELEFFVSDRADLNKYVPQPNPTNTNTTSPEPGHGTLARVDFDANGNEIAVAGSEATKIWDMDFDTYIPNESKSSCVNIANANGSDSEGCQAVLLDSRQGTAGSGDFDMRVMLSVDLFKDGAGNLLENSYVYLYNFMGAVDDQLELASAGFEEWITVSSVQPPPPDGVGEPGTVALLALGVAGFVRLRRSR